VESGSVENDAVDSKVNNGVERMRKGFRHTHFRPSITTTAYNECNQSDSLNLQTIVNLCVDAN